MTVRAVAVRSVTVRAVAVRSMTVRAVAVRCVAVRWRRRGNLTWAAVSAIARIRADTVLGPFASIVTYAITAV